jgi:hypothetical protein
MKKTNDEFINEESAATQCNRILAHMQKGLSITSLEALQMYGCMRLASRIHDLRERGENIIVERINLPNGKTVAQYKLAV